VAASSSSRAGPHTRPRSPAWNAPRRTPPVRRGALRGDRTAANERRSTRHGRRSSSASTAAASTTRTRS
jgi:hypothetical protein